MSSETSNPPQVPPFRACGSCGKEWANWEDLILDPRLRLLGFQVDVRYPDANLLVFEHRCGSSVSVLASRLRPFFREIEKDSGLPSLYGTHTCNKYCSQIENLVACDRRCANARDRHMIQLLLKMKMEARKA
jgi:hypothetical protein